jgi:copper chaperone CopZ
MDKIALRVEGMSCGHCEIAVQDAIRKLPGIKKAKASKRKKEVSVKYDAALTYNDAVIHAIAGTGYQAIA